MLVQPPVLMASASAALPPAFFTSRYAAVFDLDNTLVPNTSRLFLSDLYTAHPDQLRVGPFSLPSLVPPVMRAFRGQSNKSFYQNLEQTLGDGSFDALFAEYHARASMEAIYPRMAEEIAWRRANLQAIVIVTGAFQVVAQPYIERFSPDYAFSNSRFDSWEVTGRKKPGLLKGLFKERPLLPHSVFTDAYKDRFMLTDPGLPWVERYVINPDRELRRLSDEQDWKAVNLRIPAYQYPRPVRDYAMNVIRSDVPYIEAAVRYYRRWDASAFNAFSSRDKVYRSRQRNYMAVAGLWANEAPYIQQELLSRLTSMPGIGLAWNRYLQLLTVPSPKQLDAFPLLYSWH